MNSPFFGVMQGRLLPKYKGRYQAHPVNYWQNEFDIAKSLQLDCIEFILDYNDVEFNPLMSDSGVEELLSVIEKTSVLVKSVCVDYLMEAPLHSADMKIADQSKEVLLKILKNSKPLGVKDMVIPCVDQSSLSDKAAKERFIDIIKDVLPAFQDADVNLSLETDLAPKPFAEFLEHIDSGNVTVNYDIGNSASLGFDYSEELAAYGEKITDIHIKDRLLHGGPCVLGQGNADFKGFFEKLTSIDYQGPFIMQAYRDDEGVEIFRQQAEWIRPFLTRS